MSVLVKGMKMSKNCIVCPFAENVPPGRTRCLITCRLLAEGYKAPSPERNEYCPLVALPDKHGRLVDADELKTAFPRCDNNMNVKIASVRATINHMDTIVEAEDEE